ncbi:MAG: DsbA family protein [Silicimonas sp.]|jgi:protein-disulfide isomerase|nr:DsbA family protein [Silicimonas sp.]
MTRTISIFVALACLAIGGWVLTSQNQTPADAFGAAFAQDASEVDTSMIQDMTLGNPDATVTVVEYASFTCPHCAAFHAENFKKLKADYIDSGKIKFVYRDVYFDRPGLWAAIVARCGEGAENRFFGIADMLYQKQRDWAGQDTPQAIVDRLRTIGKTAGLSDDQLEACLSDGDNAQALYAYYVKNVEEDGVNSTPSFVINGKKYSNMPYEEMKEILDAALAS